MAAGFADDFGYDLDEDGQPLSESGVGETSRADEGLRTVETASDDVVEEEAAATA